MSVDPFTDWCATRVKAFLKELGWRFVEAGDTKPYYYDKATKKSQWQKPKELVDFEKTLTRDSFLEQTNSIIESSKEQLEAVLCQKDSVLEPDIINIVTKLTNNHNVSTQSIATSLSKSYVGYPQMIIATMQCIKLAKLLRIKSEIPVSFGLPFNDTLAAGKVQHISSDSHNEETLVPMLVELVAERFNRTAADKLLTPNGGNNELPIIPDYVDRMVQDPVYNQTIQELFLQHRNSTLLEACCTGAYIVRQSEGSSSSAFSAPAGANATTVGVLHRKIKLTQTEQVFADSNAFQKAKKLLQDGLSSISHCSNVAAAESAGESAKAQAEEHIVHTYTRIATDIAQLLETTSSETVKLFALQIIQSALRSLSCTKTGESSSSETAAVLTLSTNAVHTVNSTTDIDAPQTLGKRTHNSVDHAGDETEKEKDGIVEGCDGCGEDRDEQHPSKKAKLSNGSSPCVLTSAISSIGPADDVLVAAKFRDDLTLLRHQVQSCDISININTTIGHLSENDANIVTEAEAALRSVLEQILEHQVITKELFSSLVDTLTRYPDTKYLVFLAHPVIQSLLLRYMLSISQFSPQFHSYEQQQQPLQCVNKQQYEECIKLLLRAEEWVSWEPHCAEESCSKINENPPLIHSTIANCDAIAELFNGKEDTKCHSTVHDTCKNSLLCAAYVLQWAHISIQKKEASNSQFFGMVLDLLVDFATTVAAAQPFLLDQVVQLIKALWVSSASASLARDEEDAMRARMISVSLERLRIRLIEAIAKIFNQGCVEGPVGFILGFVETLDMDLVRHLLHCMLADGAEGGGSDSSPKTIQGESSDASAGLVEIFYTNGAQKAVRSHHFAQEDRAALLRRIQGMKSSRLSSSVQQKRAELEQLLTPLCA